MRAAAARALERNVDCRVDRDEALRYLGYGGQDLDAHLEERIGRAIVECESLAAPAYCYQVFPVAHEGGRATLVGSVLSFECAGTLEPFAQASHCAVMACTLGLALERGTAVASLRDGVGAVVLDAAGSSLVEACAEACERAIAAWAAGQGLHAGQRTSPGYGDMPLAWQGTVLALLDAGKRLGVTATDSHMMIPSKSVTALVGLFERESDARRARRSCADCIVRRDCVYLKAGNPCNRE